jgi:hypothetical protein
MSVERPNLRIRLSPVPLKETQNRIIGLICPFLPPHDLDKCPPIRKMDGRGTLQLEQMEQGAISTELRSSEGTVLPLNCTRSFYLIAYTKSVIFLSTKRGFTCLFGHLNWHEYVSVNVLSRGLKPERRIPAHPASSHANRVENSFCVSNLANLGHGTGSSAAQSS